MKIYIAMVHDRHADPEPFPFSTPEAAITFASKRARELCLDGERFEEHPVFNWLYSATYSAEGDAVWVEEKELDNPS